MRRTLIVPALLVPFLLAGCGRDTPDTIADEMISMMKEVAGAIDSVKDEATAKDAAARIDAVAAKLPAFNERAAKVRATAEGKAAFEAKITAAGKEMGDQSAKLMKLALSNRKASEIVMEALQRFASAIKK